MSTFQMSIHRSCDAPQQYRYEDRLPKLRPRHTTEKLAPETKLKFSSEPQKQVARSDSGVDFQFAPTTMTLIGSEPRCRGSHNLIGKLLRIHVVRYHGDFGQQCQNDSMRARKSVQDIHYPRSNLTAERTSSSVPSHKVLP